MTSSDTKPYAEFDRMFQFESLLNEISTFFINLPFERIDSEIEAVQTRICEFLNLDRSALFQISGQDPEMMLTHFYQLSGLPEPADRRSVINLFPWSLQKVLDGEIIRISKITDLPEEASIDLKTFIHYGTKSAVIIPLSVEKGKILGLLTFSAIQEEREWPDFVVEQFKAVAQIFANALARKQADLALRESEARLNVVAETAEAGLWIIEPDTGFIWLSSVSRKLFHLAPGEKFNYKKLFKMIHPDDHEQFRQALQQATLSGEDLRCEYRVVFPDKGTRWRLACGKRYPGPKGKPTRIMGVSFDITERMEVKRELEERLQFESLIADISTGFVNQSVDLIDSYIEKAERRIGELLNIDLLALWQWSSEDPDTLIITHLYSAQQSPESIEGMSQDSFPWSRQQLLARRTVCFSSLNDLPVEAAQDRESCRLFGLKSNLTFPLSMGDDRLIGILSFNTTRSERDWPVSIVKQLQLVAQIFTNALEHKRKEDQLRKYVREIEELKQRVEQENIYLQQEVKLLRKHKGIVGQSLVMKKVLSLSEQVAQTDATVTIQGETGTGKGLLAQEIHNMSSRKNRSLVTVNCASLPPSLIESELFGREKGAYTGALTRMAGRFEVADGSTIFLDEIGELPHDVQSKLLQVLEQGGFERLGSTRSRHVNVRIIAATNRDLAQDVKEGKFRKDLYYRLNVFPISIPPLRERTEDIPLMVWTFVKEFQKKMGKKIENIPRKTMEALQCHHWPGNVRELRNVIENAIILNKGKNLIINIPGVPSFETDAATRLDDVERRHIMAILKRRGWRVAGKGGAAEALGLKRTTLYSKMKRLGIDRPPTR